jgi:uncharacterized membrane protein
LAILEFLSVYILGALGYGGIEILWRGHTHWTMLVTGGVCFTLLYLVANFSHDALWKKWIMGAFIITAAEFVAGTIVNLHLGWNVWDYSHHSFNLMGQICPLFTFFWFLLSIPGVWLCQLIYRFWRFRPQEKARS